jgi:hypothetical protein
VAVCVKLNSGGIFIKFLSGWKNEESVGCVGTAPSFSGTSIVPLLLNGHVSPLIAVRMLERNCSGSRLHENMS